MRRLPNLAGEEAPEGVRIGCGARASRGLGWPLGQHSLFRKLDARPADRYTDSARKTRHGGGWPAARARQQKASSERTPRLAFAGSRLRPPGMSREGLGRITPVPAGARAAASAGGDPSRSRARTADATVR